MKYLVTVEGREVEVTVDGDRVTVDGRELRAHLESIQGTPEIRVVIDGRVHLMAVAGRGEDGWQLVDRGSVRDVAVIDERTHHIRSLTSEMSGGGGGGVIKAPMPGLVMKIEVEVGQLVVEGQGLVVLEAMKMENELKAPSAGVVENIRVVAGQAVEKGEVLVSLAPAELE